MLAGSYPLTDISAGRLYPQAVWVTSGYKNRAVQKAW